MPTDFRLGVFFTFGVRLREWVSTGLLDREILLYRKMMHQPGQSLEVTLLTYGGKSELDFADRVQPIKVLPMHLLPESVADQGSDAGQFHFLAFIKSFFYPFLNWKRLREFDGFKTNQIWGSWVAVTAKWITGKPLVVRCGYELYRFSLYRRRTWWKRWGVWLLSFAAYRSADQIILTSESDAEFVSKTFFIDREKISVLPNFVDVETFSPTRATTKNGRFVFVGRFDSQKNLKTLIQAAQVAKVGVDFIGGGPEEAELKECARECSSDIRFLGKFPNEKIPTLLSAYTAFVLPSLYEGNPKALLEAMSCGLPVIGTRAPGIESIIQDRETGLVSEPTIAALARALKALDGRSEKSEALAQNLGKSARNWIVQNCSSESVLKKELRVYASFLRGPE